jgi:hypothetical protein
MPTGLDPGIAPFVLALREQGVETFDAARPRRAARVATLRVASRATVLSGVRYFAKDP